MTGAQSTAGFTPGMCKLPPESIALSDANKASAFRLPGEDVMRHWSSEPLQTNPKEPWPRLNPTKDDQAQEADGGDGK